MKKNIISSKEADLYLDNTYSSVIYKSSEEFISMQNKFKKILMTDGIPQDFDYNIMLYKCAREEYESSRLFDIAAEKIGHSLWSGMAWHDKNCHKLCPLGTVCDKKLFSIGNDKFCYGQIYLDIPYKIAEQKKYEIMSKIYYFIIVEYIKLCNVKNDCICCSAQSG